MRVGRDLHPFCILRLSIHSQSLTGYKVKFCCVYTEPMFSETTLNTHHDVDTTVERQKRTKMHVSFTNFKM